MTFNSEHTDNFLAHYGVPGMKWGKQKFGQLNNAINDRLASRVLDEDRDSTSVDRFNEYTDRAGYTKKLYGKYEKTGKDKDINRTLENRALVEFAARDRISKGKKGVQSFLKNQTNTYKSHRLQRISFNVDFL